MGEDGKVQSDLNSMIPEFSTSIFLFCTLAGDPDLIAPTPGRQPRRKREKVAAACGLSVGGRKQKGGSFFVPRTTVAAADGGATSGSARHERQKSGSKNTKYPPPAPDRPRIG